MNNNKSSVSIDINAQAIGFRTCLFFILVNWTCFLITVSLDHFNRERQSLPSISQSGNQVPENSIQSLGVTISSVFYLLVVIFRFFTFKAEFNNVSRLWSVVNWLSTFLGASACAQMAITSCFDSRAYPKFHTPSAYAFFVVAILYQLTQAALSGASIGRVLTAQLCVAIASALLAIVALMVNTLTRVEYGIVALLEIVMMWNTTLFFWLVSSELGRFQFQLHVSSSTHTITSSNDNHDHHHHHNDDDIYDQN
jgi:hypothetical protein